VKGGRGASNCGFVLCSFGGEAPYLTHTVPTDTHRTHGQLIPQ